MAFPYVAAVLALLSAASGMLGVKHIARENDLWDRMLMRSSYRSLRSRCVMVSNRSPDPLHNLCGGKDVPQVDLQFHMHYDV